MAKYRLEVNGTTIPVDGRGLTEMEIATACKEMEWHLKSLGHSFTPTDPGNVTLHFGNYRIDNASLPSMGLDSRQKLVEIAEALLAHPLLTGLIFRKTPRIREVHRIVHTASDWIWLYLDGKLLVEGGKHSDATKILATLLDNLGVDFFSEVAPDGLDIRDLPASYPEYARKSAGAKIVALRAKQNDLKASWENLEAEIAQIESEVSKF